MKSASQKVSPFFLSVVLASCATIDPEPITSSNFSKKGIRYYETRPFVVVHKPFPLESESVLVDGMVSPDGMTFLVTGNVQPPFTHYKGGFSALNGRLIMLNPDAELRVTGQGDSEEEKPPPASGDKPANPPIPGGDSTAGVQTGRSSLTLTTDNTGIPVISLNQHISLTYLPDYDREYVMSAEGRFGIKKLKLVRGPGGTLLGLNAEVDNGAIINPLMNAYSTVIKAGSEALVAALSPSGAVSAVAQGANPPPAFPEELHGKPFTFRLHHIKFAAVGLYPMVKPSEVAAYASAANTKVLQPQVGYQIPYRYFELLVAEPLFVDDVLAFTSVPNSDDAPGGTCDKQITKAQATPDGIEALVDGADVTGLRITEVKIEESRPGCVSKVTAFATKSVNGADSNLTQEEKNALVIEFEGLGQFPNTSLVIADR
jgi:hypothetical protein